MEQILITPAQCRMARSLLDWTQTELAERCELSPVTINKFEKSNGDQGLEMRTLEKLRRTLEAGGVEFLPNDGVGRASNKVMALKGRDGFAQFRQLVLNAAKQGPLEVCVSNVDENQFDKWGEGKVNDDYRSAMAKIKSLNFRILIKENEKHMTGSQYAVYRWLPEHLFGEISFYVFGDKVSIISFKNDDFNAFVISHKEISEFYRKDFERLWQQAHDAKVGA